MAASESYPLLEELEPKEDIICEYWDWILIFKNPYDLPRYEYYPKDLYQTIPIEKANWVYDRIFRIHDWDNQVSTPTQRKVQRRRELLEKHSSSGAVKLQVLNQIVIQNVVKMLQKYLNMKVKLFYSRDRDEIFCKIQATDDNLQVHADLIDYMLQFKKQPDEILDFQRIPPYAPFEKSNKARLISSDSCLEFYKRYNPLDKESEKGSLFQSKDRIKLIFDMLNVCFDIGIMQRWGIINTFFPAHVESSRIELSNNWGSFVKFFKLQDIQKVREYFGERLGMYFAWLEFMLIWMATAGLVGLTLFAVQEGTGGIEDTDDGLVASEICLLVMALFLPVFATILEQLWLRRQNVLAWEWGQLKGKHINKEQRPEYKGKYMKDPISGKFIKVELMTRFKRFKRIFSFSVILLFTIAALAALIAIFTYRASLAQDSWGPRIIGIVNALQIKIFNIVTSIQVYKYVATHLNNWENHATNNDYENAMILKLFLFQFVNSYSSLFYIAFAKGRFEGCVDDDCLHELTIQLSMIFVTMMALNIFELGIP
jgi:hypothetical protein